ncbi:SDR family oxidoreductase [Eisenibacter elegans]|jgi:short-subunit dehydrogenase|uniref:SDR family oxidoreductase n=1 Tax=Eisenibacter elegans TaxID=997 RepID=UPI0004792124|nr:SDR family oxidoreductase [Eisenibacter elegans]
MTKIKDKTVLITGGASGIGRLMGERMLERGAAKLVIWDINDAMMQEVAEAFRARQWEVYTYNVDVSDVEAIQQAAAAVEKEVGTVDLLINNAGVVVGKEFVEHSHHDIDFTMSINTAALMHISLAFLPTMIAQGSGHIINIASAAGLVSNPKMAVYCASKWAVIGWSDSLWLELKQKHPGITVSTVTPYYINTGMFDGVRSPIIPIISPELAVAKILRGIERNKRFVRMPGIIYLLPLVKGLLSAGLFDLIVGKGMGVYKTMTNFKGRKATQKTEVKA